MILKWNNKDLMFYSVELTFKSIGIENIFADKNNKTLKETLEHKRYSKLKEKVYLSYFEYLDWGLGHFLFHLKLLNDNFYLNFLNKNGDQTYSIFYIDDERYLNEKGLYAYIVDEEIKYIGRCRDSFRKRLNQGYGKIHPKNCYIDGQSTNCHLNHLITVNKENIRFFVCPMNDEKKIVTSEEAIIKEMKPEWNLTFKY